MNPYPIQFENKPNANKADRFSSSAEVNKTKKGESFSKVLDDEMKSKDKKNSQEEKTDANESKENAKSETIRKAGTSDHELSPLRRFIYELINRDPLTWSLADREHYQVKEISEEKLQQLRKELSARQLKLPDLSSGQIKTILTLNSRQAVSDFLDKALQESLARQEQGSLVQASFAHFRNSFGEIGNREGIKESQIFEQIIQHISLRNIKGGSEVSLVLKPESLGEVRLQLVVQGNKVSAKFESPNRRVCQVLKDHLIELNQALSKQGLDVKSLEVEKIGER